MTISIQDVCVINPASGLDQVGDLHIEADKIIAIDAAPTGFSVQKALNGADLVVAPGLVDLGVALREPGYGRKGNVESETRAAAAGGITSLCCLSYTRPVLDTPAVTELILGRAREAGNAKVYPIGALIRGFGDEQPSELVALHDTGYVAFINGLHGFASSRILRRALEYAATFDLTVILTPQDTDLAEGGLAHEDPTASFLGLVGIPETVETVVLARNLLLVEQSGVRVHFSQSTSIRGIELVAQAQTHGPPMTCDVALYRLILTDEALVGFSSSYHVQPSLHTRIDREALRGVVKNGVVQAIVSHHQPHEADVKNAPFAATEPGISGTELLLPLAITLVQGDLLDPSTLLACPSHDPAQALCLLAGRLAVGQATDLVLFDPQGSTLAGESWYSKGQNNPSVDHCLLGRARYTLVNGHLTHEG